MRRQRYIVSGSVYEVCFRARADLPLPPNDIVNTLIRGAMARTQRNRKVVICHYLWMSNHAHFLIVAKDAELCKQFYAELQKRVTDSVKRLMGLQYLQLWEGRPMVALVADLAKAKDRIAYFYTNPSSAGLVNSMEEYPGVSSWSGFKGSELDSNTSSKETWVRMDTIKPLKHSRVMPSEGTRIVSILKAQNLDEHELEVFPNAWIRSFGEFSSQEIFQINTDIRLAVFEREQRLRDERKTLGRTVLGADQLRRVAILKRHEPKKRDRKVFVLSSIKELRLAIIKAYDRLRDELRELYKRWKAGDHAVKWPPGVFRPGAAPVANAI